MPLMGQFVRCLAICLSCLFVQGAMPVRSQIVIGAPYPQTGAYQAMGGPVKIGIDLAVEEWNKRVISSSRNTLLKDNQKLVVTPVDDKCEPSQALVAANDLVSLEKSIQVVIGHNC